MLNFTGLVLAPRPKKGYHLKAHFTLGVTAQKKNLGPALSISGFLGFTIIWVSYPFGFQVFPP